MYSFSLVLPNYNSQSTIDECLSSICVIPKDFPYEMIIVDDGSTDKSIEMIEKYPGTLIKLPTNSGPSIARNTGVAQARNDIILFLDSDIVVEKDILQRIVKNFKEKKVACVVGVFSTENLFTDFFSQYKSLYCNYKYRSIKGTAAINTAITAIKKDVFQKMGGFNTKMVAAEDNELANRLSQNGYKIFVDCNLEVIHIKKFSFLTLMKNDYKKSISLALIFFRTKKNKRIYINEEFTDIQSNSILNVPLVYSSFIFGLFGFITGWSWLAYLALVIIIYYLYNNISFWKFIKNEKNITFTVFSVLLTYIDYIFVGLGVFNGFYIVLLENLNKRTYIDS